MTVVSVQGTQPPACLGLSGSPAWVLQVKGRPATREEAPVIVCNHVSACEPLFLCGAHLPMVVTAAENLHLPFVGVIVKALQVLLHKLRASSLPCQRLRLPLHLGPWSATSAPGSCSFPAMCA